MLFQLWYDHHASGEEKHITTSNSESETSTSTDNDTEVKCGVKSRYLRKRDKNIIVNIRTFFSGLKLGDRVININQVTLNTSLCAGVSEKSVKNIVKEHRIKQFSWSN